VSLEFRKNWLNLLLIALVVAMSVEILYLIDQNRQLRRLIAEPRHYYEVLKQDDAVPPFSAPDLNGNTANVQYGSSQPHRVLMWFSAACPACEENLQFWNNLYLDHDSDRIRLLGVCMDDSIEAEMLADEHGLEFPILILEDLSLVEAYKGSMLPQTVLVSPEGAVLGVWRGPLHEENKGSIITTLTRINTQSGEGGDVQ
jgi:peroxiredoxin